MAPAALAFPGMEQAIASCGIKYSLQGLHLLGQLGFLSFMFFIVLACV